MAYTLFTNYKAKSISYGGSRTASSIKYLVYHYTGNQTDKALNNAKYFANTNTRAAGAHYFVDDNSVYQSIDDLKIAYAVGGSKYSDCAKTGGGTMYGKITNTNSISIEMCSTNGIITEATMKNAAELGKKLMAKYNIPITNVYRHTDVTGKHCPGWTGWLGSDIGQWTKLKGLLGTTTTNTATTTTTTTVQNKSFIVQVLVDDLNIRKGAGTSYATNGTVKKGIKYTIVETNGSWGKLKSGAGWINISTKYVKRV